jgi:hypothetical protein
MPTTLVVHEVEDVDQWLKSPKRQEFLGPRGFTVRTFVDPTDAHRVALILDGPTGAEELQQMLQTQEAADAMKHDGVRPDTILVLVER